MVNTRKKVPMNSTMHFFMAIHSPSFEDVQTIDPLVVGTIERHSDERRPKCRRDTGLSSWPHNERRHDVTGRADWLHPPAPRTASLIMPTYHMKNRKMKNRMNTA